MTVSRVASNERFRGTPERQPRDTLMASLPVTTFCAARTMAAVPTPATFHAASTVPSRVWSPAITTRCLGVRHHRTGASTGSTDTCSCNCATCWCAGGRTGASRRCNGWWQSQFPTTEWQPPSCTGATGQQGRLHARKGGGEAVHLHAVTHALSDGADGFGSKPLGQVGGVPAQRREQTRRQFVMK